MENLPRALWLAVLERVFDDAFNPMSDSSFDVRSVRDARQEAIDYVVGNCKAFKQLCWRCNLNPSWVRRQFIIRMELND